MEGHCQKYPVTTYPECNVNVCTVSCLPWCDVVEVSVFVLRVLSELSLLLLVQESDGTHEIHETHAKERTKEPGNGSQIINVFSRTLFPRYVGL